MKSLLILVLCSVSSCLAFRECSEDALSKCPKGLKHHFTISEELDASCRRAECYLDLADRCGDDFLEPVGLTNPINGYRKMYYALCYEHTGLREKYLDNAACIFNAMRGRMDVMENCGIRRDTKEEFCRNINSAVDCLVNYIFEKCGQDAADVFPYSSPQLDPDNCLS